MDESLKAIAEPHRRRILSLVAERELPAGAIAARFAVSRPAVSQHLRVLVEAGLVSVRKQGTRRLYRARPERLSELKAFLDRFWAGSLDRLTAVAEAEARRQQESLDDTGDR